MTDETYYNRLGREALETTDPEHFMRLAAEMRRTKRRARFTIGNIVAVIVIGSLTLFVADIALYRLDHPVRLPVVGWIGDPRPPADPGDCDRETPGC